MHFRRLWVAYLVLALSLIPTAAVYYRVRATVESRDRARFERITAEEYTAIEQRIPHYLDEMRGVRGLFAANQTVTTDQWRKYIESLMVSKVYPGIGTLGYLERVEAQDKSRFLAQAPVDGEGSTGIEPPGDRPVYFPVLYLNHFDTNLHGGFGRDHFADPARQPVMALARDTGQPQVTGKVPLITESNSNRNSGFAIYLPVYRSDTPLNNPAERQVALQGFIFANFESEKLIKGILGWDTNNVVDCEVFDGPETSPEHLLFDGLPEDAFQGKTSARQFSRKTYLPVLNRTWTLRFSTLPAFAEESQRNLPIIALICWLTLGFLLFGITYAEVNARGRSEKMTSELRRSEAALAVEKERLAVTLYSIGDGVLTTDTKGNVLSINKVAEQLTGWTQAEAFAKPLGELLQLLNENTREPYPNLLEAVLRTGTASALEHPAILVARDGIERIISDSAAPIRDRDGGIIGAVVVFRDVTAKQKSEAELLKESKLESVGLLAGGIAHDFNNILQGIIGNLSLARMNSNSAEKMLERLAGVEKSAMRAKDLTQQLVMFARGGAPIRKRVVLTNSVRDATLFALHGSNVNCEFSLPTDIWPVDVDEGQFRQVINNIVLNAVQAMPDGGRIEVRAENVEFTAGFLPPLAAGKYVKISVRDFGTGIRPEHLPRIFDPYFTSRKGARGLGLASAYSVIRKHEGQINVDTYIGQGSTFNIYLPAAAKPSEAQTSDGEQKRFFGQGRILVMDDEGDILILVREMLELMGYEVEVARDGAEACQRYMASKRDHNPFSAVIMDLTIPEGMGGKEAIKRLRELDPDVKGIVSSGYSYDPVMANFREFGFSGVIPKPYVMEDLGRVLDEVLRKPKP